MSVSGFTVGQDLKLNIIIPNFGTVEINEKVSFDAKVTTTKKTIQPISLRNPISLVFHEGWTGTIEGERNDDTVDSLWARLETAFYSGENILGGTITQTIKEKDGSLSRYIFTDVQFALEDAGTYKGNDSVPWRFTFEAGRRLKLAAA